MSGITQAQAQTRLDALLEAESAGSFTSVSIAGRTVSFRSAEDLRSEINYWARIVAGFQRQSAGQSRHGFKVANFQNTQ